MKISQHLYNERADIRTTLALYILNERVIIVAGRMLTKVGG
jgi:hypothetical protein